MRVYIFLVLLLVAAAGFYWIWQDANGLVLVEQAKDGFYHSYTMDGEKTKTGFSFDFLRQDQGIYAYFAVPFALVFLLGSVIGSILGFFAREPIDGYDFEALKKRTEREVSLAWEQTKIAQETAENAQIAALKQARAELKHEKEQAEYQRFEAEKERRDAIQAQQTAEAAIRKAQIERTDALRVAENATRKKNAAYSAAERFKRKLQKSA